MDENTATTDTLPPRPPMPDAIAATGELAAAAADDTGSKPRRRRRRKTESDAAPAAAADAATAPNAARQKRAAAKTLSTLLIQHTEGVAVGIGGDEWQLDDDERKTLDSALVDYLMTLKSVNVTPGWALAFCAGGIISRRLATGKKTQSGIKRVGSWLGKKIKRGAATTAAAAPAPSAAESE